MLCTAVDVLAKNLSMIVGRDAKETARLREQTWKAIEYELITRYETPVRSAANDQTHEKIAPQAVSNYKKAANPPIKHLTYNEQLKDVFGEVEEPANALNAIIDAEAIKKSIIIELHQYNVSVPQEMVNTNPFT